MRMLNGMPEALALLLGRVHYEHGRLLIGDILALPQSTRDIIDQWIVETEHPLAYEAGTQVYRIAAIARELATREESVPKQGERGS